MGHVSIQCVLQVVMIICAGAAFVEESTVVLRQVFEDALFALLFVLQKKQNTLI